MARLVGRALGVSPITAAVSRLVVDLNRSPHHPRVVSEFTRALRAEDRRTLLDRFHAPYRSKVSGAVSARVSRGARVIHLGIHSFTPTLNGVVRRPDVALLYDPARPAERSLCGAWTAALGDLLYPLVIGRNDPYRGASDGLTTWLRGRYAPTGYLGIEVEVNQKLLGPGGHFPAAVTRGVVDALRAALDALGWPRSTTAS
jgi:predicted N-formylglutamate amidohydrolase